MELKTNKTIKNFTFLTICAVALLQPVLTGAMEKNEAVALINKFDKEIDDRLCAAAKAGNIEGVKAAIKDAADVNAKGIDDGKTPLHWACYNNNLAMAKYLVEKGANVNEKDNNDWTPLHLACKKDNLEMVKYLVEQGANVNAKDNDGWTPLYWACRENNLELVKYLVEKGANVNATITAGLWNGWTSLHRACEKNNLEMVKYLVEQGANVNAKDNDGWTPLYWACRENNLELVKYLVEKGANVNATITAGLWKGYTPLLWACEKDNLEMVTYLVGKGADVNAQTNAGATPRGKATDLQVKAYLEMAEDFYKVNAKTMTFDAFTQKHLENYDSLIQERNRADTHNLLHLGSKAFFDAFVGFAKQHKQLNFGDGAEKEFMLLDCATRKGPHRDAWFKECFAFLNREYSFEKMSEFEMALEKELNKLPATEREERDLLTKEKNKIVQQQKGFLAIPKNIRMPKVGNVSFEKVGGFGDKVKKKLIDVTFNFN